MKNSYLLNADSKAKGWNHIFSTRASALGPHGGESSKQNRSLYGLKHRLTWLPGEETGMGTDRFVQNTSCTVSLLQEQT
jgi:hypothetical protein